MIGKKGNMKICLIADATSVHSLRWAEYFIQRGDEVHLISYEHPQTNIQGINLHVISSFFQNLYLSFIPRHIKIYFLVKKIKPDIIHAHFISKFGFHAAFLGIHPLVMSAWGDDILIIPHWSRFLWYFTKITLQKADLIYAASNDIKNKIIYNFNISPEIIKINTHGVDIRLFHPEQKRIDNNEKIVVFSNRNFYPVYSIETLLESIPLILTKKSNIFFKIMGKGPEEKALKKYVKEKGIDKYVDFIDWIDSKFMPKYLNSCDIYISTSLSDGTPVSMLEAMACGLPCIMTNVGGVGEWIKPDFTGLLFQPKNSEDLAYKIIELAQDKQKRIFIGKNARDMIIKYADKAKIMFDVEIDYNNLIKIKKNSKN